MAFFAACLTTKDQECVFPFTYTDSDGNEVTYDSCTYVDDVEPWCSRRNNWKGVMKKWSYCKTGCPVDDGSVTENPGML